MRPPKFNPMVDRTISTLIIDVPPTPYDVPAYASRALQDVAAERWRQVDQEGWTPKHDDEHDRGELAIAAGCYALQDKLPAYEVDGLGSKAVPPIWPWSPEWWKPGDRRRDLVKAAALLLAEIERLDRAAGG